MNRKRRTEILINGSKDLSRTLAAQIEGKYDVKIVEEPNNGLVMIKMREGSKKSLFYLGEVLVTEAKVQIEGQLGIGIVKGIDLDLAYWLAVVDAAYNADLEEIESWEKILEEEEIKINNEVVKLQSKVLMTKVNFETMNE